MKNLKRKTKNAKVKVGLIVGGICMTGVLLYAGIDASKTPNENIPMTMPEAIAFSYDSESGKWAAEDIGDDFTWEGYWPADENVMKNLELMEEMGQDKFWEVYGNEK